MIIRKPETFKKACLNDVQRLFGDRNSFYAGFGNRITVSSCKDNLLLLLFPIHRPFQLIFFHFSIVQMGKIRNIFQDAYSYRSVNVPAYRIFTIDSNGDVRLEMWSGKSSYIHLNDIVDQIFPPVNKKLESEYNDWNFWKQSLPEIEFGTQQQPVR